MYPLGASGGAQHSYYDFGEGWTGPEIGINKVSPKRIELENPVRTAFKPQLELHLMGRDHRQHFIEIKVGSGTTANRLVDTVRFSYQNALLVQRELAFSDVSLDSNRISIATVSRGGFPISQKMFTASLTIAFVILSVLIYGIKPKNTFTSIPTPMQNLMLKFPMLRPTRVCLT